MSNDTKEKKSSEDDVDFDIVEEGVAEENTVVEEEDEEESKDKAVSNASNEEEEEEGEGATDNQSSKSSLSNAEKRKLRKKRLKEKLDSKDSIIRSQNERIRMLEDRFEAVEKKTSSHDLLQLDREISNTAAIVEQASDLYHKSLREENSDPVVSKQLLSEMYKAQRRHDDLVNIKSRVESTSRQPSKLDPTLQHNINTWMSKNTWFQLDSKDVDSRIAKTIDDSVHEAGYDPRTPEYWEELDRRLAKHLPHRVKKRDIDEDGEFDVEYDEVVKKKPPKSVINGGGGRTPAGGRVKVTLSKERVQAIKDAGYWDDPVERNKMVKQYLDYDRQSGGK